MSEYSLGFLYSDRSIFLKWGLYGFVEIKSSAQAVVEIWWLGLVNPISFLINMVACWSCAVFWCSFLSYHSSSPYPSKLSFWNVAVSVLWTGLPEAPAILEKSIVEPSALILFRFCTENKSGALVPESTVQSSSLFLIYQWQRRVVAS